jgi:hypothetical protein
MSTVHCSRGVALGSGPFAEAAGAAGRLVDRVLVDARGAADELLGEGRGIGGEEVEAGARDARRAAVGDGARVREAAREGGHPAGRAAARAPAAAARDDDEQEENRKTATPPRTKHAKPPDDRSEARPEHALRRAAGGPRGRADDDDDDDDDAQASSLKRTRRQRVFKAGVEKQGKRRGRGGETPWRPGSVTAS